MSKVNNVLSQRMQSNGGDSKKKAANLAERSIQGSLSGFAGVFHIEELNHQEKTELKSILEKYNSLKNIDVERDLNSLASLTSEVKAINNQAAILHGERIKKAQSILKKYQDGAFTAWLKATYGNRQTPYNFLHYYEFCQKAPKSLLPYIEAIPRQAVYTLASRQAPMEIKESIVKSAQGKTKREIINMIQITIPTEENDRRKSNEGEKIITQLKSLQAQLIKRPSLNKEQKGMIHLMLESLKALTP